MRRVAPDLLVLEVAELRAVMRGGRGPKDWDDRKRQLAGREERERMAPIAEVEERIAACQRSLSGHCQMIATLPRLILDDAKRVNQLRQNIRDNKRHLRLAEFAADDAKRNLRRAQAARRRLIKRSGAHA